jgi:thiol-disulfide isomerase/thioredoxin
MRHQGVRVRLALAIIAAVVELTGLVGPTAANGQTSCTPGQPSCNRSGPQDGNAVALVGHPAPALRGRNLTGSGTFDLSSLAGKPVAVVFWLNTCPHCRAAMPSINGLQSQLGTSARIVSVAIKPNIGSAKTLKGPPGYETPQAAIKTMRLTIPTVLLTASQTFYARRGHWQVTQTPTAFIVDSHGTVVTALQPDDAGEITVPELQSALANVH